MWWSCVEMRLRCDAQPLTRAAAGGFGWLVCAVLWWACSKSQVAIRGRAVVVGQTTMDQVPIV